MSLLKSGETYGTCKIHVTRNIIGINGELGMPGMRLITVPVNVAVLLVNEKAASFDRGRIYRARAKSKPWSDSATRFHRRCRKVRDKKEYPIVFERKKKIC